MTFRLKERHMNKVVGIGLAAAVLGVAFSPATAAPVLSNVVALKSAAAEQVTDVHWRGRRAGVAIGAGIALGALAASTAYHSPYYGYGYAPAYGYYGGPVYAEPYYVAPAPTYYGAYDYPYTYPQSYGYYPERRWYGGRYDTNGSNNW
jgi:hypothetical protein